MMDIWTIAAGVYLGGGLLLFSFYGFKRIAEIPQEEEAERPGYLLWNGIAIFVPLALVVLTALQT